MLLLVSRASTITLFSFPRNIYYSPLAMTFDHRNFSYLSSTPHDRRAGRSFVARRVQVGICPSANARRKNKKRKYTKKKKNARRDSEPRDNNWTTINTVSKRIGFPMKQVRDNVGVGRLQSGLFELSLERHPFHSHGMCSFVRSVEQKNKKKKKRNTNNFINEPVLIFFSTVHFVSEQIAIENIR